MQFSLEAHVGQSWPALRFGPHWNGWASPVVTRDVLEQVLLASGEPHIWRGEIAWLGTPAADLESVDEPEFWDPISPEVDGTYNLRSLGWTFVVADQSGIRATSGQNRANAS